MKDRKHVEPELLPGGWNLIECHTIHLDCLWILLLFVVDIAHVHSQATRLWILLVLDNQLVCIQSFFVHLIVVVCVRQVKADRVG